MLMKETRDCGARMPPHVPPPLSGPVLDHFNYDGKTSRTASASKTNHPQLRQGTQSTLRHKRPAEMVAYKRAQE